MPENSGVLVETVVSEEEEEDRDIPISQSSSPTCSQSSSIGDILVGIDPDDLIDSCITPDEHVAAAEDGSRTDIIGNCPDIPSIPVEVEDGGKGSGAPWGLSPLDQLSQAATIGNPPATFYGLPTTVETLLQQHRGIHALYG